MIQRTRRMMNSDGGFTLVEMALVLIIIGIIIGAVVKGKDLVRGAEQKRIYSKFLSDWRIAFLNFYDRSGKRLGDFLDSTGAAGQDGRCDTGGATAADITDALREDLDTGPDTGTAFRGLDDLGLEAPVTNTDNAYQYNYTDVEGNTHELKIAFHYESGTPSYNYMEVINIPNELAIAIDTMIDGEADGTNGDFTLGDGTTDWGDPTTAVTARWRMQF